MKMKKYICLLTAAIFCLMQLHLFAQQRRPIDNQHPLWMIHIDVWNAADPQKIIDLVPDDIKPYACMNLSLSCQYDKEKNVYKMPQSAVRTYKSWATVCQQNGMWFTCQPASGGRTHFQVDDLETFEYFFKNYPNFLGWNFAEQFWGFDEADMGSATQVGQIALFAELVKMSHQYGGFLTISFCGNIWSHGLSPVGMMKRNSKLLNACRAYPEAILWLYKYTQPWCFYNAESVTLSPFISGLAKSYGVRYDNCGWNGAMDCVVGQNKCKYPIAAGIGTVMEQCGVNGGAVWDAPETIPTESFKEIATTTVSGYTRRNWTCFDGFKGAWIDMFRKIIDGTLYIPSREEVVDSTRIAIIANTTSGSDEDKYASWGSLYDGLYKQNDPTNRAEGQWMNNNCYFKSTGRYRTIPICVELYDEKAKSIPLRLSRASAKSRWSTISKKQTEYNQYYPALSKGDLFVSRVQNQLITYTPYTYLNAKRSATGSVPLLYNTCDSLSLTLGMLGSGIVREFSDHIDFYLNNFRTDTTTNVTEIIVVKGATSEPAYTLSPGLLASASATAQWDAVASTYMLTVKHKGAANITIQCAGNGTDRKTDGPAVAALPLPVQPAPYYGKVIIEAEDMDYKDIKSCVTGPYYSHPDERGHSGNGFAEMGTKTSGSIRCLVALREDQVGDYKISIRYTNPTKAGNMRATVNGKNSTISFEKTATNEWKKVTFDATTKTGKNSFVLVNTGGIACYIDQVIFTPADIEPERYAINVREANYGSITPRVSEAEEGETVYLEIHANEGYGLKSLAVVNGVNFTMGTQISLQTLENGNRLLSFVMPDDMVTLKPVFEKGVNVADGITIINEDGTQATAFYDISGKPHQCPSPGINITRLSDGTTKKSFVK